MNRKTIAALAIASLAATPVGAQTMLDKLIKRVTKPRAAAGTPGQPSGAVATITAGQTAAIDRLLATPLQDARTATDRTEAAPLIRALLATGACAQDASAWNALNSRHMTPTTFRASGGESAMKGMQYHDRNACLDVARIADWTKPALNALSFTAYYVAADSGEAVRQKFALQKSGDGEWLIRDIAWAL